MTITHFVRWCSDNDKAPAETVVDLMQSMLVEKAVHCKLGPPTAERQYWFESTRVSGHGFDTKAWYFEICRDYDDRPLAP